MTTPIDSTDGRTCSQTYRTYGLTVQSAFELPELPIAGDAGEADVVIERGTVEPVPESVESHGIRRVQATPGHVRLSYDTIGSFLVTGGDRIVFDPVSTDVVGTKLVRRLFENEMLGVVLHQRGRLVLHASAVVVDGEAVVFLGPRGVGKSTTAAAFRTRGYPILEDDIVSIRFEDETPVVDPGVPEMRLRPDAVEALGIERTHQCEDDGGSDKRYLVFDEQPDPVPIGGCYVLRQGERLVIEDLPEKERLFQLVDQTYTQGMLSDTDASGDHFRQCAAVVERTSFGVLQRPSDHDVLPSLVAAVVDSSRFEGDQRS
ncbi:hypothetical protein GJ629_00815 [Halapricum sp. CBA1109]|uniref:hypothetical protein n=1 Tax=Halapricum sp. CBA1109 TaxID=2668068 RepID=UPI0012F9DBC8|nr:hypothetical protein [Halapricum sp. CBA1109]MUV88610.1 hypothetical protein [Halapricum sp. CBA1109]